VRCGRHSMSEEGKRGTSPNAHSTNKGGEMTTSNGGKTKKNLGKFKRYSGSGSKLLSGSKKGNPQKDMKAGNESGTLFSGRLGWRASSTRKAEATRKTRGRRGERAGAQNKILRQKKQPAS